MGSIYLARQRNAERWANLINRLRSQGFIIFDENGDPVTGNFVIEENGDIENQLSENVRLIWFLNDPELDNGAHDTVESYNSQFLKWTFVNPHDLKNLMLMKDW